MKLKILMIFLFVVLSTFATAEYPYLGYDGNRGGDSYFNSGANGNDVQEYTRSFTEIQSPPVWGDVNGDGLDEVVIIADNTLYVYQNRTFDLLFSEASGCTGLFTSSPIVLNDFNDNGNLDIIYACRSSSHIYAKYVNETGIQDIVNFDTLPFNHVDGEIIIGCTGVNDCIAVYTYSYDYSTQQRPLNVIPFNTTNSAPAGIQQVENGAFATDYLRCFADTPYILGVDVDNTGGEKEYVFTTYYDRNGEDAKYRTFIGDTDNDLTWSTLYTASIDPFGLFNDASPTNAVCNDGDDYVGRTFTSPLVKDFDNGETGLEICIGYMFDDDEAKIACYKKDLTGVETTFGTADAEIVGSPVYMDGLASTTGLDFCIPTFSVSENTYNLFCAGFDGGTLFYDDYVYDASLNQPINPYAYRNYTMIMWSLDTYVAFIDGYDLNEIATTYGTMRILSDDSLVLLYEATHNGSYAMIDFDPGYDDLLNIDFILNKIRYLDDNLANNPPYLNSNSYIKPNPFQQWEQNTTVEVYMEVEDNQGEEICAVAYLYFGTNDQQNGTECNYQASGYGFTEQFTAYNITSGVLRIVLNDSSNNVRFLDYNFTVGEFGVSFGDSTYFIDDPQTGVIDDTTLTDETQLPTEGNAITEGINDIGESTGMGSTVIWLMIMGLVGIGVGWGTIEKLPNTPNAVMLAVGLVGMLELILLIIGVLSGFIATGILWTLIVLGIVAIGFTINRRFSTNGG